MSQNFKIIALVVTEKMKKVKVEGGSGGKITHNSGIMKIGLRSNLSASFL